MVLARVPIANPECVFGGIPGKGHCLRPQKALFLRESFAISTDRSYS